MKFALVLSMFLFTTFLAVVNGQLYLDAGYTNTTIQNDIRNSGSKSNYFVGLHYADLVKPKFELSTSLLYMGKGGNDFSVSESYPFLDAQFSAGYKPVKEMSIFGGVSVSKLLSDDNFRLIDRELDYGVLAGIKYDFNALVFKFHYYQGLLDQKLKTPFNSSSSYISNIQIGLGFKLNLKSTTTLQDTILVSRDTTRTSILDKEEIALFEEGGLVPRGYEFGLKMAAFERFDLIYKVRTSPTRLVRYGLFATDIRFTPNQFRNVWVVNMGLNVGFENRRRFDKKTIYSHGVQFGVAVSYSSIIDEVVIIPSVGYLLGVQYTISDRIGIGIEIIPTLSYLTGENESFRIGFDTQNIGLVFNYNFNKKR